uniref:EF-hand domain-containing protein n=1 Tax=Odontella aurita TaxID=265563 RepID=A0A7S4JLD3_9STRA|mmetsp:Transcript_48715/g.146801  ORF Transcript_48715/g.146801 Transcript_48715/m.146801 type:complete len:184 (+) Transcript_48715:433-984(+)
MPYSWSLFGVEVAFIFLLGLCRCQWCVISFCATPFYPSFTFCNQRYHLHCYFFYDFFPLVFQQMNIVDLAVGGYMCFVGVLYIIIGRVTAKKLVALRKSMFTEEDLRQKFNAVDIGQTGSINFVEFKELMEGFGITLDKRESETAFIQLDKSGEGEITFEEFLLWWNTAHFDSDQNTQFALSV